MPTKQIITQGGNQVKLSDLTTRRAAELCQILASCAIIETDYVCELTKTIKPEDLVDQAGKRFLSALALTPDTDLVELAIKENLVSEYCQWLGLACDNLPRLRSTAEQAANEIKRLAITRSTLVGMSEWVAETVTLADWRPL